MKGKIHTAVVLTVVYLIGLSLQVVPALAKGMDGRGSIQIEKQCPNKEDNTKGDYAFKQSKTQIPGNFSVNGVFIPCISSQDTSLGFKGIHVQFSALRIYMPFRTDYDSPQLVKDPFPPRVA